MKTPHIIGFVGSKGVGKTTLANCLAENFGYRRRSFAAHLRQLAEDAFPLAPVGVFDPDNTQKELPILARTSPIRELSISDCTDAGYRQYLVENPVKGSLTYRSIMTTYGDYLKLKHGADYFVKVLMRDLSNDVGFGRKAVVDDVRYPYELDALQQLGAVVVRITGATTHAVIAGQSHSSETALADKPLPSLVNDSTPLAVCRRFLGLR